MTIPNKKQKQNTTYSNYKLSRDVEAPASSRIDIIKLDDEHVTKSWFYDNYIKLRKPAVIKYVQKKGDDGNGDSKFKVAVDAFTPENIAETLKNAEDEDEEDDEDEDVDDNEELLQVEELHNGGFGSGKRRLKMTFIEFLKRVKEGENLYLTTQYDENDPVENEQDDGEEVEEDVDGNGAGFGAFQGSTSDDEFVDMHDDYDDFDGDELEDDDHSEDDVIDLNLIYQAPLSPALAASKHLPPHPSNIMEPLVPQQINLWFGRTPDTTEQLSINYESDGKTIKDINKGLPTKNSTSTGLHHDHADNLYVLVKGKKRFTLFSPDFAHDLYTTGDVRTVYETGVIDYVMNEKARNWTTVLADGSVDPGVGCTGDAMGALPSKDKQEEGKEKEKQDPPSFCRIPPALLHVDEADVHQRAQLEEFTRSKYPAFNAVKHSAVQVTLEDGDLLYLPAGWFHEVTSYGDEKTDNTHVAINYWFVPPDGDSIEKPYTDASWEKDFAAWKRLYAGNL